MITVKISGSFRSYCCIKRWLYHGGSGTVAGLWLIVLRSSHEVSQGSHPADRNVTWHFSDNCAYHMNTSLAKKRKNMANAHCYREYVVMCTLTLSLTLLFWDWMNKCLCLLMDKAHHGFTINGNYLPYGHLLASSVWMSKEGFMNDVFLFVHLLIKS